MVRFSACLRDWISQAKEMESELYPEDCMVVTKISSCWVNATSIGRESNS